MSKFKKLFGGINPTAQSNNNTAINELENNKGREVGISKIIELDVLNKELSELQDAYSKEVVIEENLAKLLKTEQQTYESLNTRFHELEQQKIKHLEIAKQLADYLDDFGLDEATNEMKAKHIKQNQHWHKKLAETKTGYEELSNTLKSFDNQSVGTQTDASTNTASNNFQATTRFLDKSTTTIIGNIEPATIEEINEYLYD